MTSHWTINPLDGRVAISAASIDRISRYQLSGGDFAMAALTIRNLDESVKRRLRSRAARHGRPMEAEARAILTEAVHEPLDSAGLFTALLDRFGTLGGVELEFPDRAEPARSALFQS